jgi:citronellol/citronellal dehydrogenase
MGDAAYVILTKGLDYTGNFAIDEDVLRASGVPDLSKYDVVPGAELLEDFFLP